MASEVEIKFRIEKLRGLGRSLREAGFRLKTKRTHEMNTLFDLPGGQLRRRGELLRLRKYGSSWLLTHKSKSTPGRHKIRIETETPVKNGLAAEKILRAIGFRPSFRYEKFRAEWTDGKGYVLVDETPIGNFGEIEGPPRWIDRTARMLRVAPEAYITSTYAELFSAWKRANHSKATEMTFKEAGSRR
jgi:adenylate cyclase, class 2